MESLAQASVANANLVYANSGVNAQLRLVYGAVVSYVETGSNISGDLSAVRTAGDGVSTSSIRFALSTAQTW